MKKSLVVLGLLLIAALASFVDAGDAPGCAYRDYNECVGCKTSRYVIQNTDCSYNVGGNQNDDACQGSWCAAPVQLPSTPSPGGCTQRNYNECVGCYTSRPVVQNTDCSYSVGSEQYDKACSSGCNDSRTTASQPSTPTQPTTQATTVTANIQGPSELNVGQSGSYFAAAQGGSTGGGNTGLTSIGSYVFYDGQTWFFIQNVLSTDGRDGFERKCPMDGSRGNGVVWEQCSGWIHQSMGAGPETSDQRYSAIDQYVYLGPNSRYHLSQSLIHADGSRSWERRCPMSDASGNGVEWESCTGWNFVDLAAAGPDSQDPRYKALASYEYVNADGDNMLSQSLFHIDGKRGWERRCPFDSSSSNGVAWSSCSGWNFVPLDGAGTPDASNPNYAGLDNYNFVNNNGQGMLVQSLLHADGKRGWEHTCPLDSSSSNGVAWGSCSPWVQRSIPTIPLPSIGGQLTSGEIWVATAELTNPYPYSCDGGTTGPWCNIVTASLSGNQGTYRGDWTPAVSDTYYVVTNAYTADGSKCTGAPSFPSDWADCGSADLITVTVDSGIDGPGPIPPQTDLSAIISGPLFGQVGDQLTYSATASKQNAVPTPAPSPSDMTVAGLGSYYYWDVHGKEWLSQSMLSADGRRGWERRCPADPSRSNGINWEGCSVWLQVDMALEGPDQLDPRYSAYDAYNYIGPDFQFHVAQSLFHADGRRGWERRCPMDETSPNGVNWAGCSGWIFVPLDGEGTPDSQDPRYTSLSSYEFFAGDRYKLSQSLLHADGKRGWERTCDLDSSSSNGVAWSTCSPWIFVSLEGSWTADPTNPVYSGLDTYTFFDDNDQEFLAQSLLHADGRRGWERKCKMDYTVRNGVDWDSCGPWILRDVSAPTISSGSQLAAGQIWVSTANRTNPYPYQCKGRTSGPWCNVVNTQLSGSFGQFSGVWTPTNSGNYMVMVNAETGDGKVCTGDPIVPNVAGWSNCGPTDLLFVNIGQVPITVFANSPPVLAPIGNKAVNENQLLTFTVSATDAENDPLTFGAMSLSTVGMPAGATFNPTTRTFSWTPSFTQAGTYNFLFNVTDGNSSDSEIIAIVVGNVPRGPEFTSTPLTEVVEPDLESFSAVYSYDAEAVDQDGDTVSYSLLVGPAGSTINTGTGQIYWQPNKNQLGPNFFKLQATDGSFNLTQEWTVVVKLPPRINIPRREVFLEHVIAPQCVRPGDRDFVLVSVENIGLHPLNDFTVTLVGLDPDVRKRLGPFDLDVGDHETRSVYFDVPEDTPEGNYDMRMTFSNDVTRRVRHREFKVSHNCQD